MKTGGQLPTALWFTAETIAGHGIEPGLQVHADRGAAMKSDTLAQLLASLGASRSFSRPHVSDDNAFSEAQFKTMKYQPDYPGLFSSELHGRAWLQDFVGWHNTDHHHTGLALFTPAGVRSRASPGAPAQICTRAAIAYRAKKPARHVPERDRRLSETVCVPLHPTHLAHSIANSVVFCRLDRARSTGSAAASLRRS
jgi:hypothetical protein